MSYVQYERSRPDSFALTGDAYRAFLEANRLSGPIGAQLDDLWTGFRSTREIRETLRDLHLKGEFPSAIVEELRSAYRRLVESSGGKVVRVAALEAAGDDESGLPLPSPKEAASLPASDEDTLLDACRRCYALSLATRAARRPSRRRPAEYDVALSVAIG